MIPVRALRETITVYIRTYPGASGSGSGAGDTDRYGNPLAAETQGVEYPAAVESFKLGREDMANQDRREDRVQVFLSPDTPLDGVSRFEWRGRSYEIHGEPALFVNSRGPHHLEVIGRRILGG